MMLDRWIRLRFRLCESDSLRIRRIGALMWHLEMWWWSEEGCGWDCGIDDEYGFLPEDGCALHDHYGDELPPIETHRIGSDAARKIAEDYW